MSSRITVFSQLSCSAIDCSVAQVLNCSKKVSLVILVIVASIILSPSVHGQTTRIAVSHTQTSVQSGSTQPLDVTVTVSFQDAPPNSSLGVGVIEAQSKRLASGFVAAASPYNCQDQGALQALCDTKLLASSGSENVEFKIGGILGQQLALGTWELNVTAVLLDVYGALIPASGSSATFGVQITPISLTVVVPTQATVTVDGISETPGPATLGVAAGSHNVSVSSIAQINDTTRLRFYAWSDGFTEPNRTITMRSESVYEAVYTTQYKLMLENAANATGEGWYDANSSATFSTNQTQAMDGFLGLMGGKLVFQGWYENGVEVTNSTSGSIPMSEPHALIVNWQPDYSMPIVIMTILVLIAAAITASTLMIRKRAVTGKRGPARASKPKRPRSRRPKPRRTKAPAKTRA